MRVETIVTDRAPRPLAHYSQGCRTGDIIWLAGQLASDFRTGVPAGIRVRPEFPYYGSNIKMQTRYILENCRAVLEEAGSDLEHVVKAQVFLMDQKDFDAFDEVWREFFPTPPPRTTVQIGPRGLLVPGALVEIDLIAVVKNGQHKLEYIASDRVPKPLANYSQAVRYGDFIFLAGQLASDFKTGIAPEARVDPHFPYYGSSIERQTEYILKNLSALLEECDSDLEHVVKAQVFLKDLNQFHNFDTVWKQFFPVPPPRTTLQMSNLLVAGAEVEIDLIAVRKGSATKPVVINTDRAPRPQAHYSQAVRFGDYIFLAGQLASDFKTGVPPEARVNPNFKFYGSDIELQTHYTLKNIKAVLEEAGSSLDRVVKAQVFLTDLRNFYNFDKVWRQYFPTPPPRTTIETAGDGLLVPGTLVEIDVIAVSAD